MLRLEAVRRSFDALALAFDDGEGDVYMYSVEEVLLLSDKTQRAHPRTHLRVIH